MPARLHHERIAQNAPAPARWLALTHGIYGAGSNWRSIARRITERRPEWGVVLVDLRQHGRSEPGEPPHTIAACAEDLRALVEELGGARGGGATGEPGAAGPIAIEAIAGHSFGGKVMMAARPLIAPRQTWVLDASPSARREAEVDPSNTVMRVLAVMERLPRGWARRDDFVAALVAEGHDDGLARWLAMSLAPEPGGTLALRFDFAALREMLASYYATDAWAAIEAPGGDVEFVVAERSPSVTAADRGRLAAAPPHIHVHRVDAGHWLHIEAPAAVVELFAARLP